MINVVVDDLAFVKCDAIVRPATARLEPTTPVARRLEQFGGPDFLRRLRLHNDLAVGAAVVTGGGGELPAEFVIHAVVQSDTEPVSRRSVEVGWRSVLQRAREWEFARLTAPPIGTGAGNLTIEDAAGIMVALATAGVGDASYPREVTFVVETPEDRDVFEAALRRARAERA
ncbi:MAG TPA: macro domain-containing protein [Gemmatimonadales bacterium]